MEYPAQTVPVSIDAETAPAGDSLEYFLWQALNAADTTQRRALNHIGIVTESQTDGHVISAMLDGYPALRSGLRRGDRLVAVDGAVFDPVGSFNNVPAGFPINQIPHELSYTRNGVPDTVSLRPVFENLFDACRNAMLNSVQEFSNGNKVIGYMHLWVLSANSNDLLTYQMLLESVRHCDGLIIDVRHGTGFLTAAHLDFFFPSRRDYPQIGDRQTPSQINNRYYDREIVLLQNEQTTHGMAILAQHLGSLQRVITLGTGQGAEVIVAYPLDSSAVTDPQYEAGVMTLMSIM